MKRAILIFFFMILSAGAGPLKDENLNPRVKDPKMPGTTTPIEELNTSPNPNPSKNTSEHFRGSTINVKKSDLEARKAKKKKDSSQ